jgi:1-phosphatidylinositol-3-phosphate 5-kinase
LASLNAASGFASSPAASINSTMHSSRPDGTIKPAKSIVKSPDPDESDAMSWEESEPWTTAITRREHPRDVSSLLSLRDVLRTKRSFDSSSLGSRFSGSLSRGVANFTPPSAWAQPQVQVNLQAADGLVSQFPEAAELVEKALESQHHVQHAESPSGSDDNYAELDAGDITPTPSGFVEKHVHRGHASTIISFDNNTAPIVAPQPVSGVTIPAHLSGSLEQQDIHPSGNPFSGALSNAMRYFLGSGSPSRGPSPVHQGPHHGLLTREISSSIDDRPHIKYDWTIGKRLKFSCTVYYAKQFDALRKRCGVDNIVIKSLERSENWTAVGGKSKSNFWKSSDDRFIIKTLVNAWHVADL